MNTYLESEFYKKYQGTYYSDSILKDVFGQKLRKHGLRNISQMSYEDIYRLNMQVIHDFMELYWNQYHDNPKRAFEMIYSFYIDPDNAATNKIGDVICSADGLISLKRLFAHEGLTDEFLRGYELYRKVPIFFFPQETSGINMSRSRIFGDRIDHTLYDLKKYFEATTQDERNSCKLIHAFNLPYTKQWLDTMGSFEAIIDWWGVRGIFTTNNYEVIDIEKNNGAIITEYSVEYPWSWSNRYYVGLKEKIQMFK